MGAEQQPELGSLRPIQHPVLQWQRSVSPGAVSMVPSVGPPPAPLTRRQIIVRRIRRTAAHIGIVLLLAAYATFGGVMLVLIEHPHEVEIHAEMRREMAVEREHFVEAFRTASLETESSNYTKVLEVLLSDYEDKVIAAVDAGVLQYNLTYTNVTEPAYSWDFIQACFFCVTVITTIGYGNIAPVTLVGRAFCIVYALIGIPLTLIVIADMGKLFASFVKFVYKKAKKTVEEGLELNSPSKAKQSLKVVGYILLLVFYMLVGAVLFFLLEEWTLFESFYFCFITMTTIGLGDFVPEHQVFMLLCTAYILIGLALTSTCIELAQSEYQKSWQKMLEASKRLHGLSGLHLAEALRRLGEQIETHGDIVDMSVLNDLGFKEAPDPADDVKPRPVWIICETSL